MHMEEMIHFIRAVKTVAPVFIHHIQEVKVHGKKCDIYLEIKI